MTNVFEMREVELYAYKFIEVVHKTSLDKSEQCKQQLKEAYDAFMYACEQLTQEDLRNKYPKTPTSLISVNLTTQWTVGLVRAIKDNNKEQIDSCARNIVTVMKGNLDV